MWTGQCGQSQAGIWVCKLWDCKLQAFCRLWNFAGNSGESWIDRETSWFWAGCNPREVSSDFCNLCHAEKTNTSLIKTKSSNWDRELTLVIIQSQAAIHSDMLVTKPWTCINSTPESKCRNLQQANNNGSKRWGKLWTSWYVAKLSSAVVTCTESASQDADRHRMYATEWYDHSNHNLNFTAPLNF